HVTCVFPTPVAWKPCGPGWSVSPPPSPSSGNYLGGVRRMEKSEIMEDFRRKAAAANDFQALLDSLFDTIRNSLDCQAISYLKFDSEVGDLRFIHTEYRTRNRFKGISLSAQSGIIGAVATERKSQIVNDPYEDPRFRPEVDRITHFRT